MNCALLSLGLVFFSLTFAEARFYNYENVEIGDRQFKLKPARKSYGGIRARDKQFPYAAILSFNGRNYCGASIIHKRWAVTAAHCVKDALKETAVLEVGSTGKIGSGTPYKIKEFYAHPNYTYIHSFSEDVPPTILNDVGLIHLASDIEFNDNVKSVQLATDEEKSYENIYARQMGWGMESVDRWFELNDLRFISVKVLSLNECRKAYTYAYKHICTSNAEGQGGCHGDSGSPLVVGNVQIGIVSGGDPVCLRKWPDLYTKVASFVPWIREILDLHGDVLPSGTDIAPKSDEEKEKSLHDYWLDILDAILSLFE